MSHHIHNTEAIVLCSSAVGEADRVYWLLTYDLGLLVARAKSSREEKSKMRYGLQDLSITTVSLIEGRAGWRLTGAVLSEALYPQFKNLKTAEVAAKVFDLIKRFVPREESAPQLFNIVRDGLHDLINNDKDTASTEMLLVARILRELGYLREGTGPLKERDRAKLLQDINEAIIHADL